MLQLLQVITVDCITKHVAQSSDTCAAMNGEGSGASTSRNETDRIETDPLLALARSQRQTLRMDLLQDDGYEAFPIFIITSVAR